MHRFPAVVLTSLLLALVGAACAPAAPVELEDPRPLGLSPFPEQLAFLCVRPGCDETRSVQVSVVGKRRVAVKRLLLASFGNGLEEQMEIEGRGIAARAGSADGQEGIRAFLEKRRPVFG